MPASSADEKRRAARETIDLLTEISTLLNTGLDRQSLSYCVSLIENGVNPEALAVCARHPIHLVTYYGICGYMLTRWYA